MKDALHHLDDRLRGLRPLAELPRPDKGWLRAIRDALGMTGAQMGRRLGISQPSVAGLERAEVAGAITLNTLQRAAEALGCRVVYALVPDRPLSESVLERARLLAGNSTIALEPRPTNPDAPAADEARLGADLIRAAAEQLRRRPARLWDDGR